MLTWSPVDATANISFACLQTFAKRLSRLRSMTPSIFSLPVPRRMPRTRGGLRHKGFFCVGQSHAFRSRGAFLGIHTMWKNWQSLLTQLLSRETWDGADAIQRGSLGGPSRQRGQPV